MSKLKHTQGKWETIDCSNDVGGYYKIDSEKGDSIAEIEIFRGFEEQCQADAQLIASAPEMLEMLQRVESRLEYVQNHFMNDVPELPDLKTLLNKIVS